MSYKITDTIIVDQNKNIGSIGIATFAGPVIIGGGTSTGTVSQPLQVTGTNGAYIGGNLGIGSTNPSSKLWVSGDIYNTGIHTAQVLSASKDPGTGIATDFTNSLFGNGWRVSSPGSTTYYKLATLPPGGGGNTFDHLIINGVLGAWTNGNQTPFEITFSNRGAFNYKYISYGSVRSDVRIIGISTNSSVEIWAQHQASQFTKLVYNIPNSIESIVVSNPTSTTTAPTGTTVFDSSTVTPRFIINESDNIGIGTATPTSKLSVVGGGNFTGIVTATSFSGNLKGGSGGTIVYQSATDTTAFLANGTGGYVLQSNGGTSAPSWVPAAPSGAVSGITVRDSNSNLVGTSGSVTQLTFSTGLSVTGTSGAAGIATITLSSNIVGSALSISGISTFTNGPVLIGSATSTGTASQPLQVTGGAYVSDSVGIGTTNPSSTLDVRATGATIRVQNPAVSNYSVLLDANTGGPRISLGQNGDNVFVDFGAYVGINNLDTKARDLRIFSTAAPNAFTLKQDTGNIGINTTNPGATLNVVPTATSIAGLFSGTTSSDMVRITQLGSGNALVVEDSANPDATPFVVKGDGSVGIGTASPAFTADIAGDARVTSTNKMRFGGTAGTTNFYIQYNSTANSLDFVAG